MFGPRRVRLWNLFKRFVSYFVVIIISVSLTAVGAYLFPNDSVLFVEFLIAVLVASLFISCMLYSADLLDSINKFAERYSFMDITLHTISKTVTFGEISPGRQIGKVESVHDIENHMNAKYKQYLIEIMSDQHAPNVTDCKISINGERLNLSEKDAGYELNVHKTINEKNGDESFKGVACKYRVPVEIEPKGVCNLNIQYDTTAYAKGFDGKTEYIGLRINQKTEYLQIKVKLEGEIKKKYQIFKSEEIKDGERRYFEVLDASDQRMLNYENILKEKGSIPQFKSNHLLWSIYGPKVGYKYFVYFCIKKI
ncbi:hypothetical protein E2N92_05450 [Methanofollis formosanus]|uniref:Uncharacterized protein n=1 Tax=Methanofollis formosanus TaxID=299308 RepID=A0A8G1A1Z2_9EURY|nr:hypothetical protein [Methanofollis formosanus]QYZ78909.1 hypothetical protein E2N92_05450 [Methanofollis formosanus]